MERLTIGMIVGGRAKMVIIATIHGLLSDSAYARRAEKARYQKCRLSSKLVFEKMFETTANRNGAQYGDDSLSPNVGSATKL